MLPEDSVDRLHELTRLIAEHAENFNNPVESFFMWALEPYYSPLWDGGDRGVLDIVYRLSDRISQVERRRIMVYPSPTGEILLEDGRWDSLEQFRREWENQAERQGRFIPTVEQLPSVPALPMGGDRS